LRETSLSENPTKSVKLGALESPGKFHLLKRENVALLIKFLLKKKISIEFQGIKIFKIIQNSEADFFESHIK